MHNHFSLYIYIFIDHLAVCITVMISAVYDLLSLMLGGCMFLLKRDSFLNHCSMKPLVIVKVNLIFVVLQTFCYILFYPEKRKRAIFKGGRGGGGTRMKL